MPDKVTTREDIKAIYVESYDVVTGEDLMNSMQLIANLKEQTGYNKIYVDASKQTSMPDTTSIFEFGATVTKVLFGMKMAIFTSPTTRDDVAFLEDVAGNRGAIIRLFDSEEDALEWLQREG
ncbi:hypothetical protein BVX94_01000 [bacterium B17]|nr:hypothetical protein BVX94_01000 [bacterium B17]